MQIKDIFASDPKIKAVRVYKDGHVPDSPDLETFGRAEQYVRDESQPDGYRIIQQQYNRKAYGPRGPAWIAIGYRGGLIDSGEALPQDVSPSNGDPYWRRKH